MKNNYLRLTVALISTLAAAVGAREEDGSLRHLAVNGASWAVSFDLDSFGLEPVEEVDYNKGSSRRLKTGMTDEGLMLSVFVEPIPRASVGKIKTSLGCRNLYGAAQKKFPIQAKETKRMEYRGMALLQRDYEEVREDGVFTQRSVRAYLFHQGHCVDLHISKTNYETGDGAILNKFLNRVKLVKDYKPAAEAATAAETAAAKPEAAAPASEEDLNGGIMAYMSGDYKNAAEKFGRVVEREKKQRTLGDRTLIPVIDNLGIAYGQLGQYEKSQAALDYGLSLFPSHTPFNYNKACGFAEAGDLDKAIAELEKAYANNPRLRPYLSNPARDSSFAKYRSDPRFIAFLKRSRGE